MRTEEFTLGERKPFSQDISAPRARFRRILRVNLADSSASTSFFRFIEQHTNEHTPSRITYISVKILILLTILIPLLLQEPSDVEFLNTDSPISIDQFPALLMQEVSPLIGDLPMKFRQLLSCSAPLESAFLLNGKHSLRIFERLFGLPQPARVLNPCIIGQSSQTVQSEVYADRTFGGRQNPLRNIITGNDYIPALIFALDSDGFDFPFNLPVLAHLDGADFREPDFLFFDLYRAVVCLRVGEGIEEISTFETRETCLAVPIFQTQEETLKCFVQIAQRLPEHLRIDALIFRELGTNFRDLFYLVVTSNRPFMRLPSVSSLFKSRIIENSATTENRKQSLYLRLSRIDSEFEGLSHFGFLRSRKNYTMPEQTYQELFFGIAAVSPRLKSGVLAAYFL